MYSRNSVADSSSPAAPMFSGPQTRSMYFTV